MNETDAERFLEVFLSERDEAALWSAVASAEHALATSTVGDPEHQRVLEVLADVMFAYFGHTGHFAVIDCAVEMLRRRDDASATASSPKSWAMRHPTWEGGEFRRSLSDSAWTLQHADGRRSHVWKDWSAWVGEGWPTGWHVRRPDGAVIELGEDTWGDSWQLDETAALTASNWPGLAGSPMEVAAALQPPYHEEIAELDQSEVEVVLDHLGIWQDLRLLSPDELALLRDTWTSHLPHPADLSGNAFGWILIALSDRAITGILREVLAAQRDVREYLHVDGADHLNIDLLLAYENHWESIQENFLPTDVLRSALMPIGGVPEVGVKSKAAFWETLTSVERIRAIDALSDDALPNLSGDWDRFSVSPVTLGEGLMSLDAASGGMLPLETRPGFGADDLWLATLVLRCAFAHAACAPAAVNALLATV